MSQKIFRVWLCRSLVGLIISAMIAFLTFTKRLSFVGSSKFFPPFLVLSIIFFMFSIALGILFVAGGKSETSNSPDMQGNNVQPGQPPSNGNGTLKVEYFVKDNGRRKANQQSRRFRIISFLKRNEFVFGILLASSFVIAFFGFVNPVFFVVGLPLFAFFMFIGYHMVNQAAGGSK